MTSVNNQLYNKEHMAKVVGRSLSISTKQAIEVCNFIRNKTLKEARRRLQGILDQTIAVPFRRFIGDMGHKKKIGPGRYPIKVAQDIMALLDSVEANAQFKGLDTSNLLIYHISPNKASTGWHYGRQRRRKMKRTHIEIIVHEIKKENTEKLKEKPKKAEQKK